MKGTTRLLLALLSIGSMLGHLEAQPQQSGARLESIAGETIEGDLIGIDALGNTIVRLTSGEERRVALDELARIDLQPKPDRAPQEGTGSGKRLWLRSEQVLAAVFRSGDGSKGTFWLPFADKLEIPWRFIQAVRFDNVADADPGFLERAEDPPDTTDYLYAIDAKGAVRRLSVRFLGVKGDKIEVRFQGDDKTMPLQRVYGVVFGKSAGTRPDAQSNPLVRLRTRDGLQIAGKLIGLDDEQCGLRLDEGMTLSIDRRSIASILVRSDKLVYLTDLEPRVEQTPAFDRVWPWLRNEGPGGAEIRLGGKPYRFGVVLFPRTRLAYAVDGRYDVFETVIGLEDGAGERAHAVFRVIGDGRVLLDSGPMTRDSEPRVVKVPITNVQRLTLEADFGKDFDLGDICVFAMPRVLRN